MTKAAPEVLWQGAEALRQFLVPIDTLEPFPGNPNRGDIEVVRASYQRFGQVAPVIADGVRIVAGHTRVEAAREEGWTHVAVIPNDFGSEEEARAYLLVDNRSAELGVRDQALLAVQLDHLGGQYEGTGYSQEDRDELEQRLAALRASTEPPPQLDERSPTTGLFEVPLLLDSEARKDFARLVRLLEREWGIDGTTDVVVRAVREAAERA